MEESLAQMTPQLINLKLKEAWKNGMYSAQNVAGWYSVLLIVYYLLLFSLANLPERRVRPYVFVIV